MVLPFMTKIFFTVRSEELLSLAKIMRSSPELRELLRNLGRRSAIRGPLHKLPEVSKGPVTQLWNGENGRCVRCWDDVMRWWDCEIVEGFSTVLDSAEQLCYTYTLSWWYSKPPSCFIHHPCSQTPKTTFWVSGASNMNKSRLYNVYIYNRLTSSGKIGLYTDSVPTSVCRYPIPVSGGRIHQEIWHEGGPDGVIRSPAAPAEATGVTLSGAVGR